MLIVYFSCDVSRKKEKKISVNLQNFRKKVCKFKRKMKIQFLKQSYSYLQLQLPSLLEFENCQKPPAEVVAQRFSSKFRKFHRKIPVLEFPAQVSSCEICEIFKNTFFYRTPQVTSWESIQREAEAYSGCFQAPVMELFRKMASFY